MIKAIFFDFDGVIMDTMDVKLDSYCYALQKFNFPRKKIREFQLRYTGLSRKKILVLIYEHLSGEKVTETIAKNMFNRFAEHDEKSRSMMKPIPESFAFLKKVYSQYYTALISGTPQDVIKKTVEFHKLTPYFDDIQGSPKLKSDIIRGLLKKQKLLANECVFIGDGKTDQDAAEACCIKFVGLNRGLVSFEHNRAWMVVTSLMDLLPHLDFKS